MATTLPSWTDLTSKDPPKIKTQAHLELADAFLNVDPEWLKKLAQFATGAFQIAAFALAHESSLQKQQLRRTSPYQGTPEQTRAWDEIQAFSDDVMVILPSAEFGQALRVTGSAWAGGDIPPGEVALEFGPEGSKQRRSHSTPLILAASYTASLQALKDRPPANALEVARMKGADAMPQLLIGLLLGLRGTQDKYPYTCALIDVISTVASVAVQRLKHCLRVPRPDDAHFGLGLTPALPVPKYSAFPAGHATVCAAVVTVLIKVGEADAAQTASLEALVAEIAEDRERAGLHCGIDNREGLALGRSIGAWMLLAVAEPTTFGTWSALFMKAAQEWDPPPASAKKSARKFAAEAMHKIGRGK